jgi:serine/threonine protein kinase
MQPIRLGRRIGSFLFEQEIGIGSFASVWKAHHTVSHSSVAIKVILKSTIDTPVAKTRLQREIALLKQLQHPFIAQLFQVAEDSDAYYLIMELVEHGNLMDHVNEFGELSEEQARRYFLQLVSVLDYLHNEKRIAHRDLKCENVLLDRYNNIRLIDFGLSNMFSDAAPNLSTACGSPAYAAPEMVLGGGYTQAADIWSAGILLFSIVAGFLPFEDEQIQVMFRKILHEEPDYPPTLSPQLVDLLRKMLCKDAKTRITATAIQFHPWFSQSDYAAMLRESRLEEPISDDENNRGIAVDPDIIQQISGFGLDCRELAPALIVGEFTELTALYRIMRRDKLIEKNRDLFRRMAGALTTRAVAQSTIRTRQPEEVKRIALSNVHVPKSLKRSARPLDSGQRTPPALAPIPIPISVTGAGLSATRRLSRPTPVRKPAGFASPLQSREFS